MYTIINKETGKVTVIKETTQCADYLGVGRSTLYDWFSKTNIKETPKYTIYKADFVNIKSKRGKKYWK